MLDWIICLLVYLAQVNHTNVLYLEMLKSGSRISNVRWKGRRAYLLSAWKFGLFKVLATKAIWSRGTFLTTRCGSYYLNTLQLLRLLRITWGEAFDLVVSLLSLGLSFISRSQIISWKLSFPRLFRTRGRNFRLGLCLVLVKIFIALRESLTVNMFKCFLNLLSTFPVLDWSIYQLLIVISHIIYSAQSWFRLLLLLLVLILYL